jgi:hypothetical protein
VSPSLACPVAVSFFFSPVAVSLSGAAPKARTPLDRRQTRQADARRAVAVQPASSFWKKAPLVLFVSEALYFFVRLNEQTVVLKDTFFPPGRC